MKTNVIYLTVLIFILCLIVALPFIKIPISISSKGVIRPVQENSKIVSLVGGRIVQSNIHSNNQEVKKGDTLLVVTSDLLNNKLAHNKNQFDDYHAQLFDLNSLVNERYGSLKTGLYQLEYASFKEKMAEIQSQVNLAKKELDRNQSLYDHGIISTQEHEKLLFNYERLFNQLNMIKEQQHALWHSKKREIEQQVNLLSSDHMQLQIERENYVVQAPFTGRLTNNQGLQVGNYVVQGQHIVDLSSEDNLIAECYVPTSSIGFIAKDQIVRFQIDTYNYNQWGMLTGKVIDVDYNLSTNEQSGESFFRVRCALDQTYLTLKNGYQVSVGKGHTYTARFYLLDRTLWQLIFDRVDDWFNPNLAKESTSAH